MRQLVQWNDRWHTVDMLKGVAIICVILSHVQLTVAQRYILLAPFWMWMAVPVFMVLSGFNFAASIEKAHQRPIEWFSAPFFMRKLSRFLYPFIIVEVMECCWLLYLEVPWQNIIHNVLSGGYGPGGYYNSMLIQLLSVISLLYAAIEYGLMMMQGGDISRSRARTDLYITGYFRCALSPVYPAVFARACCRNRFVAVP